MGKVVLKKAWELDYQERGIEAQRLYPNEELLRFMGRNLFSLTPKQRERTRVLEIGCGSGANLWMVAKEGFNTHGIDSSPRAVELCKEHLSGKWGVSAQVSEGSAFALPYPDSSFDVVFEVQTFQHFSKPDKEKAIDEVRRILKPNGLFFSYHLGAGTDFDIYPRFTCHPLKDFPLDGWRETQVERIHKSYGKHTAEFLVITAKKRN